MVYAIQIDVHNSWRTVSVSRTEARAAIVRISAANSYGSKARVKAYASEALAWRAE